MQTKKQKPMCPKTKKPNRPDGILSLLSLTKKAGKSVSGELAVERAIRNETARLILVSEDASDNTKKKFKNMTQYRKIPFALYGEKEELGRALGQEMRSSVAITDEGFAKSLQGKLSSLLQMNGGSYGKDESI